MGLASYFEFFSNTPFVEIYWKRHEIMVNKLLQMFPDKQIITTTHSAVLPKVLPKEFLYDLEEYKIDETQRLGIELIYPDIQLKTFTEKLEETSPRFHQNP